MDKLVAFLRFLAMDGAVRVHLDGRHANAVLPPEMAQLPDVEVTYRLGASELRVGDQAFAIAVPFKGQSTTVLVPWSAVWRVESGAAASQLKALVWGQDLPPEFKQKPSQAEATPSAAEAPPPSEAPRDTKGKRRARGARHLRSV